MNLAVLDRRLTRLELLSWRQPNHGVDYRADPVGLCQAVGIAPDPWQVRMLLSASKQTILNCSRQSGKSQLTAIKAAHRAIGQPGALILVLSPSLRQSGETFRKVRDTLRRLGTAIPRTSEESALSIRLVNGSRLVCLPGKEGTVRGFSGVDLLIVDEASRVADELYMSIRPMLAVSQGSIILLSSPFGQRGFFHQEWTEGGPLWERFFVTALDCPRISAEWLESERETMGDYWFNQEYMGVFADTDTQAFSSEHVMAAVSHEVLPLFREAA